MRAEARGLIHFGKLSNGAGEFGNADGRGEFERRLRGGFAPAAAFEQAEHLAIFERGEVWRQLSRAVSAKAPTNREKAAHGAPAEINQHQQQDDKRARK